MDLINFSRWLNVTEQQMLLLSIVNTLNAQGILASPKNISEEFKKFKSAPIQKSNLFTQLKSLRNHGFLVKTGKASYSVAVDTIKSVLNEKKKSKLDEASDIEKAITSLDEIFSNSLSDQNEQYVDYLEYEELFDQLEKKLRYAKEYCIVSTFPNISLTFSSNKTLKRGKYMETLYRRCFQEKKLRIVFVTKLNIPYLFEHSLLTYKDDVDAAYKECRLIIDNLENQARTYSNLDIRYHKNPYGFDFGIPIVGEVNEFYIFIRDDGDNIVSGVHIKSKKIAKKAYEQFMLEANNGRAFKGKDIATIRTELLKLLDVEKKSYITKTLKKSK